MGGSGWDEDDVSWKKLFKAWSLFLLNPLVTADVCLPVAFVCTPRVSLAPGMCLHNLGQSLAKDDARYLVLYAWWLLDKWL